MAVFICVFDFFLFLACLFNFLFIFATMTLSLCQLLLSLSCLWRCLFSFAASCCFSNQTKLSNSIWRKCSRREKRQCLMTFCNSSCTFPTLIRWKWFLHLCSQISNWLQLHWTSFPLNQQMKLTANKKQRVKWKKSLSLSS